MSYKDILKDLKAKKYSPIYVLHGAEPYFIDLITSYIEKNVLTESEKSFNQTIIYGKDADYRTVVDNARRYPVMAERQVLIIKEAQNMKGLGDLIRYVENPAPTTLLLICHKHKKLDSRTKFAKALKSKGVVFESKKIYEDKVPDWVSNYLRDKGLQIAPENARLVAEYLGTNLSKISNELDKLAINVPANSTITTDQIQQNIGISKDYNVFELQAALAQRNGLKANRIVNYFISNPKSNPMPVVIGALFNYFSKLYIASSLKDSPDRELASALGVNPFFVKDYKKAMRTFGRTATEKTIHILQVYDLKSKGVGRDSATDGDILKELVYKILHVQ